MAVCALDRNSSVVGTYQLGHVTPNPTLESNHCKQWVKHPKFMHIKEPRKSILGD